MHKYIEAFLLFLFSQSILAEVGGIEIQSQFYLNGKLISKPSIITMPGETSEIVVESDTSDSKDKFEMKVIANNTENKSDVAMNFDISYLDQKNEIKASPRIVTKLGEQTIIHMQDESGKKKYEFRVIAKRR